MAQGDGVLAQLQDWLELDQERDGIVYEYGDDSEVCECDYPHSNDYDPYNFERCTCKKDCWHLG